MVYGHVISTLSVRRSVTPAVRLLLGLCLLWFSYSQDICCCQFHNNKQASLRPHVLLVVNIALIYKHRHIYVYVHICIYLIVFFFLFDKTLHMAALVIECSASLQLRLGVTPLELCLQFYWNFAFILANRLRRQTNATKFVY